VLLASSVACPVQAFRVGANVYATQFHPELDEVGVDTRVEAYKHAGYFHPSEADEIRALARRSDLSQPPAILRAFAARYGADGGTGYGTGASGSRDGGLTSAIRR
jgi:GMP synthase (glutamine-hydrolysing)